MLLNLNKQTWMDSLGLRWFQDHCDMNQETMESMLKLAKLYKKASEKIYLEVYDVMNKIFQK